MGEKENFLFEYDPEKNRRNIETRALSFGLAEEVFADPNMKTVVDNRRDYGEVQFSSYGRAGERCLKLCWTWRGDKIRVITLYQVHKKEWEKYYGKDDR